MSGASEVWAAVTSAGIDLEVMDDSWGYRHRYGSGGPFISREAALQAALQDLFDRLEAALASQPDPATLPSAPDAASQPDRIEQAIDDAAALI